jgi:hypothetical protein
MVPPFLGVFAPRAHPKTLFPMAPIEAVGQAPLFCLPKSVHNSVSLQLADPDQIQLFFRDFDFAQYFAVSPLQVNARLGLTCLL